MTRIKICGFTRPEDAVAAARLGVDAIGLVFYPPSPRYVSIEQAQAIIAVLPPFVTVVGLFVNPEEVDVRRVLQHCVLDVLQFHGEEDEAFCLSFQRPYLKAIHVNGPIVLSAIRHAYPQARGILLDTKQPGLYGGTGIAFDWSLLPERLPSPFILAGGIHPGNIVEAISRFQPVAVDVSSGVESAKGIKSADKMAAFISGVKHG